MLAVPSGETHPMTKSAPIWRKTLYDVFFRRRWRSGENKLERFSQKIFYLQYNMCVCVCVCVYNLPLEGDTKNKNGPGKTL
jgi:hypothetical protein